jgi:heterodisulfide reductase subunit C
VQLGQTALDPRNDPQRIAASLERTGIFNCVSCYKCEEVCPAGIPIVSQIIEPLKAKAAALVPAMAHHAFAVRAIVAARGRVDPGALVLRVQGWRALLRLRRIVRLLVRGKISPLRTVLAIKTAAAAPARRILGRGPS